MCDSGCECGGRGGCHRHRPDRGWVQLLFLRLIHERSMHGYQLMEELNGRGYLEKGKLEAGTVYTLLRRMETRGLLTSEWMERVSGPDRRMYRATEEGEDLLRQGIEAMLGRKAALDDLASYYESKLRRTDETG